MVNKIKSGVLSLLLFASLSCSKDDGIRTDEGPQLQSMIVSLFTGLSAEAQVEFKRDNQGVIEGLKVGARVDVSIDEFIPLFEIEIDRDGQEISSSRVLLFDGIEVYSTVNISYVRENGRIVQIQSENGEIFQTISLNYNADGQISQMDYNGLSRVLFYDNLGNVERIRTFFDSRFSDDPVYIFDARNNPFQSYQDEKILLLSLLDFLFTDEGLFIASVFSNNNVLFDSNTYREDDFPYNIGSFLTLSY